MTLLREEQIKKQADIYTDDASNYTEWSDDGGWSDTNDVELVGKAFIEGAKWADAHPKSPWISVEDDLPCNHSELVRGTEISEGTETIDVFVATQYGYTWDDYMVYENGKWRWNDFEPTYWMIPPKLPKE